MMFGLGAEDDWVCPLASPGKLARAPSSDAATTVKIVFFMDAITLSPRLLPPREKPNPLFLSVAP